MQHTTQRSINIHARPYEPTYEPEPSFIETTPLPIMIGFAIAGIILAVIVCTFLTKWVNKP